MRFVPDHRLRPEERARAVACDGLCEAALHLSHWRGNATPARFKADLSTEMALRFAVSGERQAYDVATNDHHDADGALSLFAALQPEAALPQADLLVAAAAFGDFQHGSDEEALKLAAVLEGLASSPLSPLADAMRALPGPDAQALATEKALAMLPTLGGELERFWTLWADELAWFQASRDALRSGALAVTDLPAARLSVVEWEREPHPAVVDRAAAGDLALVAVRVEQGYRYRAAWRGYSWAETVSPARPPLATVGLEKLCLPLNSLEPPGAGRWRAGDIPGAGMTEALRFCGPGGEALESRLAPDEVAEKLAWFLVERRGLSRGAGR